MVGNNKTNGKMSDAGYSKPPKWSQCKRSKSEDNQQKKSVSAIMKLSPNNSSTRSEGQGSSLYSGTPHKVFSSRTIITVMSSMQKISQDESTQGSTTRSRGSSFSSSSGSFHSNQNHSRGPSDVSNLTISSNLQLSSSSYSLPISPSVSHYMHDNELDLDEITMREDIDLHFEYHEEIHGHSADTTERHSDVDNDGKIRQTNNKEYKNNGGGDIDDFSDHCYRQHQQYNDHDDGNDDREELENDIDNYGYDQVFGHDCDHVFEDDDDRDVNANIPYDNDSEEHQYDKEDGSVETIAEDEAFSEKQQESKEEGFSNRRIISASSGSSSTTGSMSVCSSVKSTKIELDNANKCICSIQ